MCPTWCVCCAPGSSCAPCPRALPLMPSFLEPNNHAFIRGTIAVAIVIEIVRDLLARNHVDSHFDAEKCRVSQAHHMHSPWVRQAGWLTGSGLLVCWRCGCSGKRLARP